MQTGHLDEIALALGRMGWLLHSERTPVVFKFLARYPEIERFASQFRTCVSPDEKVWLYGWEDFSDDSDQGWRFLEQAICLQAAQGDAFWTSTIKAFWSSHLPFALSVRSGYSSLLIDTIGRISLSIAPEFESPILIADSIESFVELAQNELVTCTGDFADFIFK